jgi:hypothetical protein
VETHNSIESDSEYLGIIDMRQPEPQPAVAAIISQQLPILGDAIQPSKLGADNRFEGHE